MSDPESGIVAEILTEIQENLRDLNQRITKIESKKADEVRVGAESAFPSLEAGQGIILEKSAKRIRISSRGGVGSGGGSDDSPIFWDVSFDLSRFYPSNVFTPLEVESFITCRGGTVDAVTWTVETVDKASTAITAPPQDHPTSMVATGDDPLLANYDPRPSDQNGCWLYVKRASVVGSRYLLNAEVEYSIGEHGGTETRSVLLEVKEPPRDLVLNPLVFGWHKKRIALIGGYVYGTSGNLFINGGYDQNNNRASGDWLVYLQLDSASKPTDSRIKLIQLGAGADKSKFPNTPTVRLLGQVRIE